MMMIDPLSIISHFYSDEPELRDLMLKHAFQVRAKARQILAFSGLELDCDTISAGALLHDIGIIRCHAPGILCNGELPYIAHGVAGAEMLRDYGQAHGVDLECFARICERHTGSGLTEADIRNQDLPLPYQDFLVYRRVSYSLSRHRSCSYPVSSGIEQFHRPLLPRTKYIWTTYQRRQRGSYQRSAALQRW